jgi:hypothetical protein
MNEHGSVIAVAVTLLTSATGGTRLGAIADQVEQVIRGRLGDAGVREVRVVDHADDATLEPGHVGVQVLVELGSGEGDAESLSAFRHMRAREIEELERELRQLLPQIVRLELSDGGRTLFLALGPEAFGRAGQWTAVMARLGPLDLETLDTLIAAGIAPNRAEAVRWALARIRERPAYEELLQHGRAITELKKRF